MPFRLVDYARVIAAYRIERHVFAAGQIEMDPYVRFLGRSMASYAGQGLQMLLGRGQRRVCDVPVAGSAVLLLLLEEVDVVALLAVEALLLVDAPSV